MLKDVTIGQYYAADSFLHRLDPRTKIIGLILYMVGLFMIQDLRDYLYVAAFTAVIILLSGVPFKILIKGIKSLWVLLVFTLILNFFMYPEGRVLWEWKFLKLTEESLQKGIFMAVRLVLLLNVTSLLTLTTTPILLTDGLERMMKACRIPMAHELAMMMTIALRFIPTLIEETDKIMKAQIARGADFESGNLLKRAKGLIPLLIPLFLSAFRRADELAMAMEARCYRGGQGRTRLKELKYRPADLLAFTASMAFLALSIADRFWIKSF